MGILNKPKITFSACINLLFHLGGKCGDDTSDSVLGSSDSFTDLIPEEIFALLGSAKPSDYLAQHILLN